MNFWNCPKKGVLVDQLRLVNCVDYKDIIYILKEGNRNRQIGTHELNKDSSWSHSILTMYLISKKKN